VLAPELVVPDVERVGESVDVLGDAELLDAGLARGLEVAVDVLRGEIELGARLEVVRAQVDVVVREHAPVR
jgi:hypothetical protein